MDLFEYAKAKTMENESPLASRLRPTRLEEVVGQQHIVGKDKLLYRAIKADKLTSVIFYGPPGTGKTTLAKVIANTTSADFTQINATVAGKKDMEEVVKQAQNALGMYGRKTILFIDEIHRFNKGQQDYLLPFVEDGTIILIGATTENPYFEVNGALLSRSIVFELKALEIPEIKELILRAVNDKEKGMGSYGAVLDEDALEFLADMAGGDARRTGGQSDCPGFPPGLFPHPPVRLRDPQVPGTRAVDAGRRVRRRNRGGAGDEYSKAHSDHGAKAGKRIIEQNKGRAA